MPTLQDQVMHELKEFRATDGNGRGKGRRASAVEEFLRKQICRICIAGKKSSSFRPSFSNSKQIKKSFFGEQKRTTKIFRFHNGICQCAQCSC
ncbi:unnamed protein product [Victoria cruziana]